jgi:DNA polymerase III alpha subunit (gram-positive type)
MYLLGIDIETTGLDPDTDEIIELGAVVWDSEQKKPIELFSQLISIGDRILPKKIVEMTGITDEHLKMFGLPISKVIGLLDGMASKCEFYVGHNALRFDNVFLEKACAKISKDIPKKTWIDTTLDIDFPQEIKTRKLSYLAAEHKFVGFEDHRAVFDVLTMFKILSRYDINEICDRAKSDLVQVIAKVTFENKNLASENGFRWEPSNKTWIRVMRQFDLARTKFPFGVNVSKSDPAY